MLGLRSELGVVSRAAALCSAPAQHDAALRAGWNDAAWGQPRREVETAVAPWSERGYAGGLLFRQKQQQDSSTQERGPGTASRAGKPSPTTSMQSTWL
jgi:hypothetical protein